MTTNSLNHPIFQAIDDNNINYIEEVITSKEFPFDMDMQNTIGDSLLQHAINAIKSDTTNFNIIKLLIDYGADIHFQNDADESALHFACIKGNLDVVKLLIKLNIDINTNTTTQNTPLHIASRYNQINFIEYLIDNGANINAKNIEGNTPLHEVCIYHQLESIQLFINKGALLHLKNDNGDTPLHCACINDSSKNQNEILFLLINTNKVNINEQNNKGYTALHYSILLNNAIYVSMLLSHGADLDIVNNDGKTCLDLAIENDCNESIKAIESYQNYIQLNESLMSSKSQTKNTRPKI